MPLPLTLQFELAGVDLAASTEDAFAGQLVRAWHIAAEFRPGAVLPLSLCLPHGPERIYHVGVVFGCPRERLARSLWRTACAKAACMWLAAQAGPLVEYLAVRLPPKPKRSPVEAPA